MHTVTKVFIFVCALIAAVHAGATPSEADWQMKDQTNTFRSQNGLAPLDYDDRVFQAAYKHNEAMRTSGVFSHTGVPGDSGFDCAQRLAAAGAPISSWGENIGIFSCDPAVGITAWINSPGHRANMLGAFTHIGVATSDPRPDGQCWWTAVYATLTAPAVNKYGRAEVDGSPSSGRLAPGVVAAVVVAAVLVAVAIIAVAVTIFLRRRNSAPAELTYNSMSTDA